MGYNSFPRKAFAAHIARLLNWPDECVYWWPEPEPFSGFRNGDILGNIQLNIVSRGLNDDGGDEFRHTYNPVTDVIDVDQISRRSYVVQARVETFGCAQAGDVMDALVSRFQRKESLFAMRNIGLAFIEFPFFADVQTWSDNRATSSAILDLRLATWFSTVDQGIQEKEQWIETVEPLTRDEE